MKTRIELHLRRGAISLASAALTLAIGLSGCTLPHNVNVKLDETLPDVKVTAFSEAIDDLGLMTEIFGDKKVRIMPKEILDNTGTSIATNAEVPRDITEMIKSTLNAIGGNVIFVPYDPAFMINVARVGFTDWGDKLLPTIIVSGGITEFDRGLETRGKNTDAGLDIDIKKINVGWEYSTLDKNSLASITLDFNVIDFLTNAGIPRVQAVNTIKVHKAIAEDSLGFTVQGNSLGFKGTVKKIQGRHASVRLLVQLSMIQLIGKYMTLPYWKLLPDGKPDPYVMDKLTARFLEMDDTHRIAKTQEFLAMHGYPVQINGIVDGATAAALTHFESKHKDASTNVDQNTLLALFTSMPISREVLARRRAAYQNANLQAPTPQPAPVAAAPAPQAKPQPAAPAPAPEPAAVAPQFVSLASNKKNFAIGDPLEITYAVSAPLYVRLYSVSSTGEITQLHPSPGKQEKPSAPGHNYELPGKNAGYTWDVSGPAGTDKILIIGSEHPFADNVDLVTKAGQFTSQAQRYPARASFEINIH